MEQPKKAAPVRRYELVRAGILARHGVSEGDVASVPAVAPAIMQHTIEQQSKGRENFVVIYMI